jgi:hypothetical protein
MEEYQTSSCRGKALPARNVHTLTVSAICEASF